MQRQAKLPTTPYARARTSQSVAGPPTAEATPVASPMPSAIRAMPTVAWRSVGAGTGFSDQGSKR